MSVFQIDRDNKVIVNKEAAKLVPELTSLSEDELRYVILTTDYVDSPYRKRPPDERRIIAARVVFKKEGIQETQKLKRAMDAYKSLIFDIRRETVDVLKQKVMNLHKDLMRNDAKATDLKNIDSSITFLEARITSIEKDLDMEEKANIELKGNRKLSMIEVWQQSQKQYQQFKEES